MIEIENRMSLSLPMSDEDFDALDAALLSGNEVKEALAVYRVS